MQIEDFLDFREPKYIRLKGSRLSVENVLWDYLDMLRMRRLAAMSRESGLPLSDPNIPVRKELEREKAVSNTKSSISVKAE